MRKLRYSWIIALTGILALSVWGCSSSQNPTLPSRTSGSTQQSQSIQLVGKVVKWVDSQGQSLSPSGKVQIVENGLETTLQSNGSFTFDNLSAGQWTFAFHHTNGSRANGTLTISRSGKITVHVEIQGSRAVLQPSSSNDSGNTTGNKMELCGEIENVDLETRVLTLGGYDIWWDDATEFENLTEADLAVGVPVKVEAYEMNDGTWYAHSIQQKTSCDSNDSSGQEMKLCGVIESVDLSARTLVLEGYSMWWDDNTEFEHMTESDLEAGLTVKVEAQDMGDGTWYIHEIEQKSSCDSDDHDDMQKLKVCGEITDLDMSARWFEVEGYQIYWDESTKFEHMTADDLAIGMGVKVEAYQSSDSTWLAHEVEQKNSCSSQSSDDDSDDDSDHDD